MSTFRRNRISQRYHKSTQGVNAQGFMGVDDPIPYSGSLTVPDFSTITPDARAGQIGLYYKDGTLVTAALVAGDEFQFVQKNSDGSLKKGTLTKFDDIRVRKETYLSPTIDQWQIGYNGTSGALNLNVVGGLQEFVAIAKDMSSANQPFPTMEGRAIVRGGAPSDYAIASQIVRTDRKSVV